MDLNVENIVKVIKELLVVFIHSVLYYHDVYPRYIFGKVKSFNLVGYKSRSNKLNDYIDTFISEFTKLLINSNRIDELMIVLYKSTGPGSTQDHAYFKYVLKFDEFIQLSSKINEHRSANISLPNFSWPEIYKQFNGFLFHHLQYLKTVRQVNDLQFKLVLNTDLNLNISDSWVSNTTPSNLKLIHPLEEVSVGFVKFNLYVELEDT